MDERVRQRARDTALVAALIITGPFCRACIARVTRMEASRLRVLAEWAHPYVGLSVRRRTCQGCRARRRTYQIG